MDLVIGMVEHHVWLVGQLLDRAERVPADVLDAPVEVTGEGIDGAPTLRSLLAHIRGRWTRVGPAYLVEVPAVSADDRLGETFVDVQCEPPRCPPMGA